MKLRSLFTAGLLLASALPLCFSVSPWMQAVETSNALRRSAKQNLITIPVQLNSAPVVPFALDSGASSTIVNERIASELHLKRGKIVIGQGAGTGDCILREVVGVRVRAGEKEVDSSVFAASLEPLEKFVSLPVNGIVGGALFLKNVISIDYRTREARILETAKFVPQPTDERILVTQSGSLCCVVDAEVEIGGSRRPAHLLIDTGALPFEVVLNRKFAAQRRFPLDARTEMLAVPGLCGISRMAGTAGIAYIKGLPALSVAVFISSDNKGALSSADFDGVIGSELLRRFGTVVFDARNDQVVLRHE